MGTTSGLFRSSVSPQDRYRKEIDFSARLFCTFRNRLYI